MTLKTSTTSTAWTWTWPSSPGSSGYILQTDGTGVTSWVGRSALSSLTSAQAADTVAVAAYSQIWGWNSLSTQTAFTLGTSSLTAGNLLSLQNSAVAVTSVGKVLNISNTTTGAGYGVYSAMTGAGNTGYAGYFATSSTSGASYAVVGSAQSATGYGGYFVNTSTGWALNATGTAVINGMVGIGTASPQGTLHIFASTTTPFFMTAGSTGSNRHSFDQFGNANLDVGKYIGTDTNVSQIAFSDYGTGYITCSFANNTLCSIEIVPAGGGFVSVNSTATPHAPLDVTGYVRLVPETAQPIACSATNNGAIALTANFTTCVCKGSSSAWYLTTNGTTACSW